MTKRTNREELHEQDGRTNHEVDTRERDSFYYLEIGVDPNSLGRETTTRMKLMAPPPRVDPHYGQMMQRWVNVTMDNGTRVSNMKELYWRPRDPSTVPKGYEGRTAEWNMHSVIMVANEMLLMETPASFFKRRQQIKFHENLERIENIKATNGMVRRDNIDIGVDRKYGGNFCETVTVQPKEGDGRNFDFA